MDPILLPYLDLFLRYLNFFLEKFGGGKEVCVDLDLKKRFKKKECLEKKKWKIENEAFKKKKIWRIRRITIEAKCNDPDF